MKLIYKLIAGLALAGSMLSSCAGTYYVTERPAEPYYARPSAPYRGAYWVPGEYVWRNGRYIYVNGYWTRPRTNHTYIQGYWQATPRGYSWHRGYWR
ncbi:hypothetical protein GCM10027037_11410 [Mucilaginibacter koreensis]